MIQTAYHYCPKCAGDLKVEQFEWQAIQVCSKCGFRFFQNQHVTCAAIIMRDNGVLLGRRKNDPHKGMLDVPGGYVEANEKIEYALLREVKEELGVEANIVKLLGVYGPDTYTYQDITTYNGSVHFLVDIADQTPRAGDDLLSIEWVDLATLDANKDIPQER